MKKLTSIILSVLTVVLLLCSCTSVDVDSSKISIVTTIFPYYDFTREITGDKASLTMLVSPGVESHDYEPSPQDIIKINDADLFIYNGGESDEWVNNILSSINNDVKVLSMFDYVEHLCSDSNDHEHSEEHHYEEDEHIWTSPVNAIILADIISKEIQSIDVENSAYYQSNTDNYLSKLTELDNSFNQLVNNSTRNTIVVADRFPLLYFTNEYNLVYESAFSGCSSDTQPSVKTVTLLIDFTNNNNIPVVFSIDFSNENLAKLIAEDTGAKVSKLYSCHNITSNQFEDGATYFSLMESNFKSLKEALE